MARINNLSPVSLAEITRHYGTTPAGAGECKYMPARRERILDEVPYVDLDFKKMEGW